MIFNFTLEDENGVEKIAIFNPTNSSFFWRENGQPVLSDLEKKEIFFPVIHKTSPTNPNKKSQFLKNIKIQMGFACNFTCNYCSQSNLRSDQKEIISLSNEKAEAFIKKIPDWLKIDTNEDKNVSVEFWGGETLLYWKAVVKIADYLRNTFPNINLGLFTNGSLITKDIADLALKLRIHFIISHDGPTFTEDRGKDPLENPHQLENIKYLFSKLSPFGLISFNATISIKNFSHIEIRNYIADKLSVEKSKINLSTEVATPYDQKGLNYIAKEENQNFLINKIYDEYKKQYPFELALGSIDRHLLDFFNAFSGNRTTESIGQKCGMDSEYSLALDLDGNVLTCQNVTANSGHKIGHIEKFNEIKLNTAYHWTERSECNACPVVQICKGSCMFLKDKLWESSCNQHFIWSLSFLAFAINISTNLKLKKIEAPSIRNKNISSLQIIN
jgi:uncharacterized protein